MANFSPGRRFATARLFISLAGLFRRRMLASMLRVIQSTAASAKGYYTSKAEYYAGGQAELPGRWGGKGAALLGLQGEVTKQAADALCENRDPNTGNTLTCRQRKDRTPGYDFNWHVCKSVSILYGLTGDQAILAAFRSAVDETMQDVEAEITTRIRKNGRMADRVSGVAVWAEYTHLTARPVGGVSDPHLHSHCFVYNAVFDPEEQRWKAGKFSGLKHNAPRFQEVFHNRLAWKLMALGYPIERTGKGWEIAGISRKLVERFSNRTRVIEAFAAERNITDAKEKDGLGARTRDRKRKDETMPMLREQWNARLTPNDRAGLAVATAMRPFVAASTNGERFSGGTLRNARPAFGATGLPPGLIERQSVANRRHFLAAHPTDIRLHPAMFSSPALSCPFRELHFGGECSP
jgi:conjugative relaxase-like TrwC/TraI family protein